MSDAVIPAVRYRFHYEDGGHNAESVMVNPRTGRLYIVTKQFAGAVYAAPKQLRTDRINMLRKVGDAPIMATDAAYAPDGSSFVIRTYFSATVYRAPGEGDRPGVDARAGPGRVDHLHGRTARPC